MTTKTKIVHLLTVILILVLAACSVEGPVVNTTTPEMETAVDVEDVISPTNEPPKPKPTEPASPTPATEITVVTVAEPTLERQLSSPTPNIDPTRAAIAEETIEPASTPVPVATETPNPLPTPTPTPALSSPTPTATRAPPTATPRPFNPCDTVDEEFRERCEAEIANDPAFGGSGSSYVKSFDPNNIPKIAKFNFSELDKLSRTSKFRSVTGHDFSFNTSEYDPTGKNCRSMKHYMIPVGAPRENALYHLTPHTFEWMSIKFFAPADGTIGNVVHSESYGEREQQFTIGSTEYPGYYFGFYHVKLDPSLGNGSQVKAGQQIGTLGNEESYAEISVEARVNSREIHLVSFFQVATDEVLEQYKARGLTSVSDVIITKEERDANPIGCDRNSQAGWFEGSYKYKADETFMAWVFESDDNWIFFDEVALE